MTVTVAPGASIVPGAGETARMLPMEMVANAQILLQSWIPPDGEQQELCDDALVLEGNRDAVWREGNPLASLQASSCA